MHLVKKTSDALVEPEIRTVLADSCRYDTCKLLHLYFACVVSVVSFKKILFIPVENDVI